MKPYKRLRNLLVHPKDKRTVGQTGECVYRIPCHNCGTESVPQLWLYAAPLEKQAGVMERGKKNTGKKWNPSATERSHGQIGKMWQEGPISQP